MNKGLKQRLIGALVLAGIAVIFLPGFFKQHIPYQVDTTSQIPPRPNITPVVIDQPRPTITTASAPAPDTMFLPDNDQPVSELEASADGQSSVSSQSRQDEPPSSSSSYAAQSSSQTLSQAPEPASSDAFMADAWVIQVASLRSSESAQALRKRLQDRGYKAYVRSAETSQGEVSRVFIGPKLDKALALEVKQEVDPVFKVNALVLPFKP